MNKEQLTSNNVKERGPHTSLLRIFLFSLFFFLFSFLPGCSSAPKRAEEIFIDRNTAAKQLILANYNANRGRYEDALIILEDTWRIVLGTDDPSLRIKTTTSRGSILFFLGRHDEAFRAWENAAAEGDNSGEPALAALARIYIIRAKLMQLADGSEDSEQADAAAEEYRSQVRQQMAAIRSDPSSLAAGYVTVGLAEKQRGRWNQAERAARRALSIHEKNRYLEDAAYDWFLIASIRSMAGNYSTALEALNAAIVFDRRAENGFGLASSWQAMGDVYQKAGQPEESRAAYRRAAEIFRAMGLNDRAEKAEKQL